jgi:uncharacterized phage protein gp47/JayE
MPINYPSFQFLNEQGQAELLRQQPDIDPTIFGSFASAFITAGSALAYTQTLTIRDLEQQAFPQSATGEFLDIIGAYEPLPRNPTTPAQGNISIPGTTGTVVVDETTFTGSNGLVYTSAAVTEVDDVSISITSLSRIGSTVTATTSNDHSFATGLTVTIAGANEADYNGAFEITVTNYNQFTYTIATTPTTPATGTISAASTYAIVPVKSNDEGINTNLSSGAQLTIDETVSGLENIGYVQFDGLTGGADKETNESYRERLILSRSIIEGVFTSDQIKLAALSVTGNTRAFVIPASLSVCQTGVAVELVVSSITRISDTATVTTATQHLFSTGQFVTIQGANETDYNGVFEIVVVNDFEFTYQVANSPATPATGTISALGFNASAQSGFVPSAGQVAVYILRDNDDNIIPSQTVLNNTKEVIITNGKLPANTAESDVFVLAPEIVTTNYDFSEISPNTSTMKAAVEAQLEAFYQDIVDFETTITQERYISAIDQTVDLQTGERIQSFELSAPVGDIEIGMGQIGVLGTVTFV